MKKFKHEAELTREALAGGLLLLLSGCAAAPPWQPPATHPTVAVTSVLNPFASLYVSGKSSSDDAPLPAKIDFDVNRQIRDTLHSDLAGTGHYAVVDMDVDPGVFAISRFTQHAPSPLHPRSFVTLDSDLADSLVTQAKTMGATFVVAAVDIRYQQVDCGHALGCAISLLTVLLPDTGWGLHHPNIKQCGSGTSSYLDYYVFVIDVDSGDTVASFETLNDRGITDIDIDHQDMTALPGPQKAEIDTDLQSMVQKSAEAALTHLNLVPVSAAASGPQASPCPMPPAAAPAQATTGTAP